MRSRQGDRAWNYLPRQGEPVIQTITLTGSYGPERSPSSRTTRRTWRLGAGLVLTAATLAGTFAVRDAHAHRTTAPSTATVSTVPAPSDAQDAAIRAQHLSIGAGGVPAPGTAQLDTATTEVVPAPAD